MSIVLFLFILLRSQRMVSEFADRSLEWVRQRSNVQSMVSEVF